MTTREQVIDAIRKYAAWLERHPDVPAPTHIDVYCHDRSEPGESKAAAMALAESYGGIKKRGGTSRWVDLPVMGATLPISYTFFVNDEHPADTEW